MACHYPDLVSAMIGCAANGILLQPIGSFTQNWVETRHRYGISARISQTSFRGETSGGVAKCRLVSHSCEILAVL